MSVGNQLDIRIVKAQLVRIFDSLKPNQDVFVQLVCGYDDGSEKVVGRTEVCKNGNLTPQWNQRFLCGRDSARGGKTLKFKVHIDHLWRSPVLCGEAEFSLDSLWNRAGPRAQEVPIHLFKKGEQTGTLIISIALQGSPTAASSAMGGYGEPVSPNGSRVAATPGGSRFPAAPSGPSPYASPGMGMAGYSADRPAAAPYPMPQEDLRNGPSLAMSVGAQPADAPWLEKEKSGSSLPYGYQPGVGRTPSEAQQPVRREPQLRQPQQLLPQQRYPPQAGPSAAQQMQQRPAVSPAQPLGQSERSGPHLLAPPQRAAPEVRGGSCGWCQRDSPPQEQSPGSPNEVSPGNKPPSTGSSPNGQSGQWWNSFIDRG